MYVILWKFEVDREHVVEFERVYGSKGEWSKFFERGEGYIGTELLLDANGPGNYVTIDRWESQAAYENFRRAWLDEYESLDERCENLTVHEVHIGSFVVNEQQEIGPDKH